jgi:hypothetical protein
MAHPLVEQLRFTRQEWLRGLEGVSSEEGARRFEPMNSIAWMVGHLACQEQAYWLYQVDHSKVAPEVEVCCSGQPPSNPPLDEMWDGWHRIVAASEDYLDRLTSETLQIQPVLKDGRIVASPGTKMLRMIYHYWFHLGEGMAVRQQLGHVDLPQFVGDIDRVPYKPE